MPIPEIGNFDVRRDDGSGLYVASHARHEPTEAEQAVPPAYLQEDMRDLLQPVSPRLVVITERRWMEPYRSLEDGELGMRLTATGENRDACLLWLKALELYRSAFLDSGEWGAWVDSFSPTERKALEIRADLLGLAGSTSKPALDAILAGYYWPASGMIRSLLETSRRVGFIRRRGEEALQWFQTPTESPIGPDGRPRPRRERPAQVTPELIDQAFEDAPEEEKRIFDTVKAGIVHFHWGAHPSPEGILQLYAGDEPFKVFGPTYHRPFCAFCLKWGLFAHLALLMEVLLLKDQSVEWVERLRAFGRGFSAWQETYNREFPMEPGDEQEQSESPPEPNARTSSEGR